MISPWTRRMTFCLQISNSGSMTSSERSLPDVQVHLFSATLPSEILNLTAKLVRDPVRILVRKDELTLKGTKQFCVSAERKEWKLDIFCDFYETLTISQATIYRYTWRTIDFLSREMASVFCDITLTKSWIFAGLFSVGRYYIFGSCLYDVAWSATPAAAGRLSIEHQRVGTEPPGRPRKAGPARDLATGGGAFGDIATLVKSMEPTRCRFHHRVFYASEGRFFPSQRPGKCCCLGERSVRECSLHRPPSPPHLAPMPPRAIFLLWASEGVTPCLWASGTLPPPRADYA